MDWRTLLPKMTLITMMEDLDHPQHNIDLDAELGQAVARGEQPPLVRIWRSAHQQGIALSKRDVTGPQAEAAVQAFAEEGLQIVVRNTGGTAVPQGPGVLHLSYMLPRTANIVTTDDYYRLLCTPLIDWLQTLGISADTGALAGSYCDGTYNVLCGGKKLVGTAQAWRGGLAGMSSRHPGYVLAHASIVIAYDLNLATERINRFYALAGNPYRVNAATSTSLVDLCPDWFPNAAPDVQAYEAGASLARFLREHVLNRL